MLRCAFLLAGRQATAFLSCLKIESTTSLLVEASKIMPQVSRSSMSNTVSSKNKLQLPIAKGKWPSDDLGNALIYQAFTNCLWIVKTLWSRVRWSIVVPIMTEPGGSYNENLHLMFPHGFIETTLGNIDNFHIAIQEMGLGGFRWNRSRRNTWVPTNPADKFTLWIPRGTLVQVRSIPN